MVKFLWKWGMGTKHGGNENKPHGVQVRCKRGQMELAGDGKIYRDGGRNK